MPMQDILNGQDAFYKFIFVLPVYSVSLNEEDMK